MSSELAHSAQVEDACLSGCFSLFTRLPYDYTVSYVGVKVCHGSVTVCFYAGSFSCLHHFPPAPMCRDVKEKLLVASKERKNP